jgi:ribonuclease PH
VQGCAEGQTFPRAMLTRLLDLADKGIRELFTAQRQALGIE